MFAFFGHLAKNAPQTIKRWDSIRNIQWNIQEGSDFCGICSNITLNKNIYQTCIFSRLNIQTDLTYTIMNEQIFNSFSQWFKMNMIFNDSCDQKCKECLLHKTKTELEKILILTITVAISE